MKIGIFTDTFTPDVNGVVTVINMMRHELALAGHETFIFCPSHPNADGTGMGIYRFSSVRFIFYQGMRAAIPYNRSALHLIPELDIVHSHTPGSMGLLAMYSAERYHIPHISTYHDLYVDYRRYLPRAIRPTQRTIKIISRLLCNRCEAIIAPSSPMKLELESYGISRPIYALPFGVNEKEFEGEINWDVRKALNLPDEDLLLFAGRLGKEKNLDFLLHTFGHIQEARPSARLIIAGDGPYRADLEEYARNLKIEKYVTFTGFLDRRDLIDLYKQADLFVFASKTDTQGIVLMEAMMAGTPPVAVNVLGPLDVIRSGETGMLVNENEEEFTAACLGLLEGSSRRKAMGAAARDWAREHSAQASTRKLLDIYSQYAYVRLPPS